MLGIGREARARLGAVRLSAAVRYVLTLGLATGVAALLLIADSVSNHAAVHGYLLWNLALAWLPFGLAVWLRQVLRTKLWSSWEALGVSIAWLVFLPNAFYMLSDFIHIADGGQGNVLNVAILFVAFVYVSVILGLSSLYLVHREILGRASRRAVGALVLLILLLCSFAVYIGRDLRWNSWDILVTPLGLLFDVSERLVHPAQYPAILAFVAPFFILLTSMYLLALAGIALARGSEAP